MVLSEVLLEKGTSLVTYFHKSDTPKRKKGPKGSNQKLKSLIQKIPGEVSLCCISKYRLD